MLALPFFREFVKEAMRAAADLISLVASGDCREPLFADTSTNYY
jgi:hypothetical protein